MSGDSRRGFNVVGRARRRVDGRAKVTGQTLFADDIDRPQMLHCKLLRSPLPHARIEGLDVSRSRAHPGVHLVLTGSDLPIEFGILPVSQDEDAMFIDLVLWGRDAEYAARTCQKGTFDIWFDQPELPREFRLEVYGEDGEVLHQSRQLEYDGLVPLTHRIMLEKS